MSKNKTIVWIIGFITILMSSYFYFRSNRYDISKEKGSYSYKIDRWTGETWVLLGNQQVKVEGDEEEKNNQKITEKVAIEKVKVDKTLTYEYSNDYKIKLNLEDLEGRFEIIGWEAEKIDDQIYLVSYKYRHRDKPKGFYFEFNTKADVIRNVLADNDLQSKYKVGIFAPPTDKELESTKLYTKVDELVANDEYEEALEIINKANKIPKAEITQLKEKTLLNYGIYMEYRGTENSSMRDRMSIALNQYIEVLKINSDNQKARSEIEQIMDIYQEIPNQSPGDNILNELENLGFNYK